MTFAVDGDLEAAFTHFQKALESKPEDPASLHSVGTLALVLNGDASEAINCHRRAKEADPKVLPPLALLHQNGERCNGLSDVYWTSSFVKKSLFDAPEDVERRYGAHISLAIQLEDSGLVDQALMHFGLAGALKQSEPTDLLLRNALMVPVLYDSAEHIVAVRTRLQASLSTLLHHNMSGLQLESLNQGKELDCNLTKVSKEVATVCRQSYDSTHTR